MTKRMREALGALSLGAALLAIGGLGALAGSETVTDIGLGFGVLFAAVGFVALTIELLGHRGPIS